MVTFKGHTSISALATYIRQNRPSLYHGATTSTVIPFTKAILNYLDDYRDLVLVDLTGLPKKMEMDQDELIVEGPVTWKEAIEFCQSKGRDLACYPTEKSACVLSGVATSATGDRSFGFGGLRKQLTEVQYLDAQGQLVALKAGKPFSYGPKNYLNSLQDYQNFKNAPVPWFEQELDLMIGTEGQLGVITSCRLKTIPWRNLTYLFLKVPHWRDDETLHLEIHKKVQSYRGIIYGCELMDQQLLTLGGDEYHGDLIALELPEDRLEQIYEEVISRLDGFDRGASFEVSPDEYRKNRQKRPALLAEYLRQNNIVKMGTDTQVKTEYLGELFQYYRSWTDYPYTLFGHLGDAHLHFNFLVGEEERIKCHQRFERFYHQVKTWQGSPFAEHGIGVLKKDYLKIYLDKVHYQMFNELKKVHDPHNIFFPMGFMSLAKERTY